MLPVLFGLSCPAACIVLTALIICTLSLVRAIGDCLFCTRRAAATALSILEQTRQRYRFVVVGYVVMPEHIHLLLTEPEVGTPSTVMQVLKQRTARALLPKRKRSNPRQRTLFGDEPQRRAFWQARFCDFNVWTTKKRVEKLRYMHRNPVKRGLVELPPPIWLTVPTHKTRVVIEVDNTFSSFRSPELSQLI
jgi:REP element-mobilizing transposase RayT